jgi:hypothetical protein
VHYFEHLRHPFTLPSGIRAPDTKTTCPLSCGAPLVPAGGFESDVAATRRGLKGSAQADRVVVKIGGDVFDDDKEQ